jgi:predicted RNase H-like nuclease
MADSKKSADGRKERLDLLRSKFPMIDQRLQPRPKGVGRDDLLDAAVAAWSALSLQRNEARQVCEPERDDRGLAATIWY